MWAMFRVLYVGFKSKTQDILSSFESNIKGLRRRSAEPPHPTTRVNNIMGSFVFLLKIMPRSFIQLR
uniref:Uncharacterized protein n=1 Tax=Brassica oleracea var. oleracea TaxID=109376 RepID=A0A0D3CD41_BRAOL